MITDKGLQMNAFADAKFTNKESTLQPPKSFNKIINLNLLTSKTFWNNSFKDYLKRTGNTQQLKLEGEENKDKIDDINKYM